MICNGVNFALGGSWLIVARKLQTNISFNKPYMTGKEIGYIAQAHASRHLAGDGELLKMSVWPKHTGT